MKIELCVRECGTETCWWTPVRATGRWRIEVENGHSRLYLETERDRQFLWKKWTSREWIYESELRVMYTETFTNDCDRGENTCQ